MSIIGSQPRVGTVVPSYNCAVTVADTVASLLSQNYEGEHEIVVVDDGSTDETHAMLTAAFADRIRRHGDDAEGRTRHDARNITLIRSDARAGVAEARNRGVRELYELGCQIFSPLDADDIATPNRVRDLVTAIGDPTKPVAVQGKNLSVTEIGALYAYPLGGRAIWGADPYFVGYARSGAVWARLRRGDFPDLEQGNYLTNIAMAYTRAALEVSNPRQPYPVGVSWGEDWKFHLDLLRNGTELRFCDSLVALVRLRPSSLMWEHEIELESAARAAEMSVNAYNQSVYFANLCHRIGSVEGIFERFKRLESSYLVLKQYCEQGLREAQRHRYWPNALYFAALLQNLDSTGGARGTLEEMRSNEIARLQSKGGKLADHGKTREALICAMQVHTLRPTARSAAAMLDLLHHPTIRDVRIEEIDPRSCMAFSIFRESVLD